MNENSVFRKQGMQLGALFLIVQLIANYLFYIYYELNIGFRPDRFKVFSFISFFILLFIALAVLKIKGAKEEIKINSLNFSDWKFNVPVLFGMVLFMHGAFILYQLLISEYTKPHLIYHFSEFNLVLLSFKNPFNLLNLILENIVFVFVFQAFLLNGLMRYLSFNISSLLLSLFCGLIYMDLIGMGLYVWVMNQLYHKSKNLLYPLLFAIGFSMIVILGQILFEDRFILQSLTPNYKSEWKTGFGFLAIGFPAVVIYFYRNFRKREIIE